MPPIRERTSAKALLDALSDLRFDLARAECVSASVSVPSYPRGVRPSATVRLSNGETHGVGEHVAWLAEDHDRLEREIGSAVPRGQWNLLAWTRAIGATDLTPYAVAALEAAAIDLALKQNSTNLYRLVGIEPDSVSYVLSFDRRSDPAREARRWLSVRPNLRFKIDVDPGWDDAVYAALAQLDAVATLDFKGTGDVRDHERAHEFLPDAMIEDPAAGSAGWSASLQRRIAFDGPIKRAGDVNALAVFPAAINLKAPRMGGFFETLRCAAVCAERDIPVYFGGMFEVGVGRPQLWALAALLAPQAPNDLAPIATADRRVELPPHLVVDPETPGFGHSRLAG